MLLPDRYVPGRRAPCQALITSAAGGRREKGFGRQAGQEGERRQAQALRPKRFDNASGYRLVEPVAGGEVRPRLRLRVQRTGACRGTHQRIIRGLGRSLAESKEKGPTRAGGAWASDHAFTRRPRGRPSRQA